MHKGALDLVDEGLEMLAEVVKELNGRGERHAVAMLRNAILKFHGARTKLERHGEHKHE